MMEILSKNKNLYGFTFLVFMLLGLVITILIMASVPPVSRDAMTHHLALPKLFLEHGGIYVKPTVGFSYYPMNLDILYIIPLYFNNDIVPKYIHFLFALLTAWFIYKYLREYAGKIYGLVGVLFFLSLPVIVKLSVTVYVDLGLIFFSWVCIYYFLKWCARDYQFKYLIYAAFFCGLALGTKYNGLIQLFIMSALTPLVYSAGTNSMLPVSNYGQRYRNSFTGLLYGVSFVLIALIIFSPWMIRNYQLTHNPVYPLYKSLFKSKGSNKHILKDLSKGTSSRLNTFQKRRYIYNESLLETTLIPIRIFFQGRDNNPKYFDGKLNPYLLFLTVFAFWKKKKSEKILNKHKFILVTFSLLFILIAFFSEDMRIRYIAPVIPPLVVLSVFGLKKMIDEISKQARGQALFKIIIALIIFHMFFLNGKYIMELFRYIDPVPFIMKTIDRDAYITDYLPEYPAIQYANKNLPEDASVLCLLIGSRTYYLDRNFHLNNSFFHTTASGEISEKILLKRLKRYGTTHIIFGDVIYRENQYDIDVCENFFKNNTKLLFEKHGCQVLEVTKNNF